MKPNQDHHECRHSKPGLENHPVRWKARRLRWRIPLRPCSARGNECPASGERLVTSSTTKDWRFWPERCRGSNHKPHENGGQKGLGLILRRATEWCVASADRRFPPPACCSAEFLPCGSCISWFNRIFSA